MNTIIAYQFNGFINLFTEDDSEIFWLEGCRLKLLMAGLPINPLNPVVAKWIIRPKQTPSV